MADERVSDEVCSVCGEEFHHSGPRRMVKFDGFPRRWGHWECKIFDQERRDAGYPEARDRTELKRMIRADEANRE